MTSISIGLGVTQGGGGRGIPFSSILALNPELAFSLETPGSAFQERTGASATTPSAVGDPIGSLKNWGTKGGWLVAPSDAARPIMRASGAVRYMESDGVDDELMAELAALRAVAGWTLVLGSRNTGSTAGLRQAFSILCNGGPTRATILFTQTNGFLQALGRRLAADVSANATGLAHTNQDIVATGIGDYTNTDAFIRSNGVQEGQNTSWLTAGVTENDGGQVRLSVGSGNIWQGRIYSALAFPRVLTASELSLVERWTAQQTGITI